MPEIMQPDLYRYAYSYKSIHFGSVQMQQNWHIAQVLDFYRMPMQLVGSYSFLNTREYCHLKLIEKLSTNIENYMKLNLTFGNFN